MVPPSPCLARLPDTSMPGQPDVDAGTERSRTAGAAQPCWGQLGTKERRHRDTETVQPGGAERAASDQLSPGWASFASSTVCL